MDENERIRTLYYTARDGALALESGDVENAYFALGSIRETLGLMAIQQGIELPFEEED